MSREAGMLPAWKHGISAASAGQLVRVLADYAQEADVWAVYPTRLSRSPKVRILVRCLADRLAGLRQSPPPSARIGTKLSASSQGEGQTTVTLQQCGIPLNTLSFDELRLIAEGNVREALRLHARGLDTLTHRPDTPPIPHVSAA